MLLLCFQFDPYVTRTRHLICFAVSTRRFHLSRSLADLSHVSLSTSALLRSVLTTSVLTSVFRCHIYRNLQHTPASVSAITVQLYSAYFCLHWRTTTNITINDSDCDSSYQAKLIADIVILDEKIRTLFWPIRERQELIQMTQTIWAGQT